MKSIIKKISQGLLLLPALVLGLGFATPLVANAAATDCDTDNLSINSGADCAKGNDVSSNLFGSDSVFETVVNILLFIIGAISVIMLIIGGIRYVVSGGDQAAVTSAKNTILYAIVGIVIAFLAYAAVKFVTGQLSVGN